MINLKPTVYAALKNDPTLTGLLGGPRIYFQCPPDPAEFPRITYYEADNKDFPFADELEASTEIIIVIDIWAKGSTSAIAQAVDNIMTSHGFYREFTTDLYETTTNVHHRPMRYRKLKVFSGNESGAVATDPWLEALALWTKKEIGFDWVVVRNGYPEIYDRPAVIWSLMDISIQHTAGSMFEVIKTCSGKIIGSLPNQHINQTAAIVEGLVRDIKIPLDEANKRYLTVLDAQAKIRPESLVTGQVTVKLSRKTTRPTEEVPLMMKVHVEGSWQ
ncbi:MAG: DUF3168 domain-containing protein [Bacillota bacterium]